MSTCGRQWPAKKRADPRARGEPRCLVSTVRSPPNREGETQSPQDIWAMPGSIHSSRLSPARHQPCHPRAAPGHATASTAALKVPSAASWARLSCSKPHGEPRLQGPAVSGSSAGLHCPPRPEGGVPLLTALHTPPAPLGPALRADRPLAPAMLRHVPGQGGSPHSCCVCPSEFSPHHVLSAPEAGLGSGHPVRDPQSVLEGTGQEG